MNGNMMANVYHGPRDLRFELAPIPKVNHGDLLIKVEFSSICASDVRVFKGEKKAAPGTILGHEFVGKISKVGEEVKDFSAGDGVTVYPVVSCGSCYYCKRGHQNMCINRKTFGYDYNGAFAEYVLVPSRLVNFGNVVKIPDGFPLEEATLTEPLGCCINGVSILSLEKDASLLIVGAGPMGLMLLIVAKLWGAGMIIVSEIDEGRRRLAQEIGANIVINPIEENLVERVLDETDGLGVDAALLSIGKSDAAKAALKALRKEGRINLFAGFPIGSELAIDPNIIHYRMLHVTASQNAPLEIFKRALKMLVERRINLKPLISEKLALRDVKLAIKRRIRLEGLKPIIINSMV